MFLGGMPRKPDKSAALKQLLNHGLMFAGFCGVVRVTPYILHYLYAENEQLTLDIAI